MTLKMKEELAKKLIKRNLIPIKKVAELCNLPYKHVLDIKKELETSQRMELQGPSPEYPEYPEYEFD